MATYAIGDVQGMYTALLRLVKKIGFDKSSDKLWLTGDLVNKGQESLEVLRYVKELGESAITVLGNHDLHLLAGYYGVRRFGEEHLLAKVLNAPDADQLLDWLRHRPLIHREGKYILVHAGLLPEWSADEAEQIAGEVEAELCSHHANMVIDHMHGDKPDKWGEDKNRFERYRLAMNVMTRMRCLTNDGRLDPHYTGAPDKMPEGLHHWAESAGRKITDEVIVCGHWAMQGLVMNEKMIALDSGAVYGGRLTAVRLEDKKVFQVDCA